MFAKSQLSRSLGLSIQFIKSIAYFWMLTCVPSFDSQNSQTMTPTIRGSYTHKTQYTAVWPNILESVCEGMSLSWEVSVPPLLTHFPQLHMSRTDFS